MNGSIQFMWKGVKVPELMYETHVIQLYVAVHAEGFYLAELELACSESHYRSSP